MIKDVMVRLTKRKGKGVFARKNFYKGEIIFRNPRGKLVNKKDFTKLSGDDQEHLNEINKTTSEIMKPPGRFVNHSCAPNSIPTEFEENASYVALKDIKKGEEITVDYRINAHDGNIWRCYCGSRICSKKIKSDFFTLNTRLQKKYLIYAPKFILNEYNIRHKLLTSSRYTK